MPDGVVGLAGVGPFGYSLLAAPFLQKSVILTLGLIAITFVTGGILMIRGLLGAPHGFEDERGFQKLNPETDDHSNGTHEL